MNGLLQDSLALLGHPAGGRERCADKLLCGTLQMGASQWHTSLVIPETERERERETQRERHRERETEREREEERGREKIGRASGRERV